MTTADKRRVAYGAQGRVAELMARAVSLFRTVQRDELHDLSASHSFRTIRGSLEAKLFWTTREDAERFARLLAARLLISPSWIIEVVVEASALDGLTRLTMDGRSVQAVAEKDLDWFNGVVMNLVIPTRDSDGPANA